jgi:Spy/CpxP family protein refolding chaperone
MGRETTRVLALLLACVPGALVITGTPATAAAEEQGRPASAQAPAPAAPKDTSKDRKDGKDKPQNAAAKPDERERRKWWLYDRAELGITEQQSASINQIFESTIPKLRETRQELDRAEEELSRTIKEHKADIATLSGHLDRVESARSQYNKTRVLMLYRMHLILSAEQRTKLEALRKRMDQDRRDREPPTGFRRFP